jgi:hypothetical protein
MNVIYTTSSSLGYTSVLTHFQAYGEKKYKCEELIISQFFHVMFLLESTSVYLLHCNLVPTFVDRGVSRGQSSGSPTVVNLSFLDRSRYFSVKYPHKG